MSSNTSITQLLARVQVGEPGTLDELIHVVYPELRRIAGALMSREQASHMLQPTALVNELFLSMFGRAPRTYQDRRHFFLTASRAMRHILLEDARRRMADKRGGSLTEISMESLRWGPAADAREYIDLNFALDRLEAVDPRAAQIVELRFFGGLTQEETATLLEISTATVERDWEYARAWLHRELAGPRLPEAS